MRNVGRVLSTGVLTLLLAAPVTAAHAEPTAPTSRALAAQADALRTRVADLRVQQSVATEAYDTAVEEAAAAVTDEVRAQTALDAATGTSGRATSAATRRVRALYMAGPSLPAGLGVLAAGRLDQAAAAARDASLATAVVTRDAATVTRAADARAAADAAAARLREVRARKSAAQDAAEQARTEVTAALAEQEHLLEGADSAVRQAVAREEEDARRAALAAAAARAAAAGVADAATADATVADAASGTAQAAIAAARTRTGLPYAWGATGPSTFDCSGLTQWAYRQAGTSVPRTSRQQYAALPKVPLDRLQPGDLVFYASGDDPSTIHHVALYLGGGRVLHAPHTGDVVREAGVAMDGLYGAVRPT
ncbi:C40 family peptidase [Kineococcus sp. SYSU DK001]|uniref:C40 family peptidase n=1 Tax=Kineococcus sp. SYSU DK001 TaxID=3383122 RepID=UPI003D7D3F66